MRPRTGIERLVALDLDLADDSEIVALDLAKIETQTMALNLDLAED